MWYRKRWVAPELLKALNVEAYWEIINSVVHQDDAREIVEYVGLGDLEVLFYGPFTLEEAIGK